jgi:hypothetical protein
VGEDDSEQAAITRVDVYFVRWDAGGKSRLRRAGLVGFSSANKLHTWTEKSAKTWVSSSLQSVWTRHTWSGSDA